MKLARIVLPTHDNRFLPLTREHNLLTATLVDEFGGYTMTEGTGAWRRPDTGFVVREQVRIYDVAMPRADVIKLREIAADTAREARQECVMIVTPNGDAEFIKPKEGK